MAGSASPGVLAPSGAGEAYQALGTTTRLRATKDETGGAVAVIETEFPPDAGIPPHSHRTYDEAFYVLDGELRCQVGEHTAALTAGAFGYAPKGVVHGFQNGGGTAKVLIWQSPAPDMQGFMEALSQLPPGAPDMARLGQIMQQYDLQMAAPPPTP